MDVADKAADFEHENARRGGALDSDNEEKEQWR